MNNPSSISSITKEKAQKILAENGMHVNDDQAGDILKLLSTLATSTLKNERKLSIHKGKHR